MANGISRECVSVGQSDDGQASVLVVSTDEDRESFKSNIFEYTTLESNPALIFSEDIWISNMWKSQSGAHFLCEILGRCFHDLPGTFVEQRVTSERLFKIWGLHDRAVYVVGEAGTCFRFNGVSWIDMSDGLSGYVHAIGGVAEDSLICAGDGGFIARWTGGPWQRIDIPTNPDLRGAFAKSRDVAYFCGLSGACLMIDGDSYQMIDAPPESFYSIAEYAGDIYFGSLSGGIFKLVGNTLIPFKPQARGYAMRGTKRYLWTCGGDQLARFNGTGWTAASFT
ncbi:hypothetical protein [Chelativorans salis]|uniref:Uncharacterized protein n=1 Tax=Chelativorans salis TaxID=2978478 RepID=A0ABT2LHU9_9HYPH|nr:hypothetical protein [Chelativorans sp. EGI FJ00035]MCT7374150.1 hypothetical protein [Chelativorans sp. EGI FJ00035]